MTVAPDDLEAFLAGMRRADAIRALSLARSEAEVSDALRRHEVVLQDDGDAPIARRPQ
jgi:hypothetical protein